MFAQESVMENPEKIEIAGLKTIHKLCNFGADHNMEGCTFTEIVERMFTKIEQMKTQVNTLDEMLLNQGEALAQAKAQAVPEGFVLVDKHQLAQLMANMDSFGKKALGDDYVSFADIAEVLDEAREPAND